MTPVQLLDTKLKIMGIEFDQVVYDKGGDVLYLSVGDPSNAVDFDATEEDDHVAFDAEGRWVRLTIVSPKWRLENEGKIEVTIPVPEQDLAPEKIRAAMEAPPMEESKAAAVRSRAPARATRRARSA